MKKLIAAAICTALLLTGCGPVGASYRELEELLLIQTLGIDTAAGSVLLSAGAKGNDDSDPVTLSSHGSTVSEAVDALHNSAYEEELFFHHTKHILIGEKTAEKGIGGYLSYICQSPEVRLGVPIYIIEGCTANELIFSVAKDSVGVSAVLEAIEAENARRNISVFSAADISRRLARCDAALACAVKPRNGEDSNSPTAVFSGYGILKGGKLRGYIGTDFLGGLGLLLGRVPIYQLTVTDMYGADVTVELDGGSTEFTPEFDGDGLSSLGISCEVSASVSEISGSGSFSVDGYGLFLEKQLESALMDELRTVIGISQELNADFLGLAERIELAAPMKYQRAKDSFADSFPRLSIGLSVNASISHSNDIGE